MRRRFKVTLTLPMPPEDFAELDSKHYDVVPHEDNQYTILADNLKHLVELLIVLAYNDQAKAYEYVCQIKTTSQRMFT